MLTRTTSAVGGDHASEDLARITDCLTKWMGAGGGLLLMTDYDGTLTPIACEPSDARLPDDVRVDLEALAAAPGVHLAIVSGRDVTDLRTRVALPGAIYVGCHGLEVEGRGMVFRHPDAEVKRRSLRALGLRLCRDARSVEGMKVEIKRLGVAVHYRQVPSPAHAQVERLLLRSLIRQGTTFKVLHGPKVIEVLPHVAWNKGHCVQWILERIAGARVAPPLPVYIGQAWTDAHTFDALAGRAVTIGVGVRPPGSRMRYRLAGVTEVQGLLAALAAGVRDAPTSAGPQRAEGRRP